MLWEINKYNKTFLQILSLYFFPNFIYFSKYFAQIYRAQ